MKFKIIDEYFKKYVGEDPDPEMMGGDINHEILECICDEVKKEKSKKCEENNPYRYNPKGVRNK